MSCEYPFHPTDRSADLYFANDFPVYEKYVWLPAPEQTGVCYGKSSEPYALNTIVSDYVFENVSPITIAPILRHAGVDFKINTVAFPGNPLYETAFLFAHPDAYSQKLSDLNTVCSDFAPPSFTPYDGSRFSARDFVTALQERTVLAATQGYETVHDYETHVPVWSVLCPELFERICEMADAIPPQNRNEAALFSTRIDKLANIARFGKYIVDLSHGDNRPEMVEFLEDANFSTIDAIVLASKSESYRQEVVRPVAQQLLQQSSEDYFM